MAFLFCFPLLATRKRQHEQRLQLTWDRVGCFVFHVTRGLRIRTSVDDIPVLVRRDKHIHLILSPHIRILEAVFKIDAPHAHRTGPLRAVIAVNDGKIVVVPDIALAVERGHIEFFAIRQTSAQYFLGEKQVDAGLRFLNGNKGALTRA